MTLVAALETAENAAAAVSPSAIRALARQALVSPRALAQLRALPVGQALRGVTGSALETRLRTLGSGVETAQPTRAGAIARQILSGRRFRGSPVPEPLHGALAWIGARLYRILWHPLLDLARHVPGGSVVFWILVGVAVAAATVAIGRNLSLRRGGMQIERTVKLGARRDVDPAELEAAAEVAERSGDLSLALRLRFRAGLVRLARARAIPARSSIRTVEVRKILRSTDFDELARSFDEVAYGGREARSEELEAARAGWKRVLEEHRAA